MEAAVVALDACAWPVLTRLDHARLGLIHFNQPNHGLGEGDLAALISHDEGRTWTPAGVPAPHTAGTNRMHGASGVGPDGTWLVLSTGFAVENDGIGKLEPLWCSRRAPGAAEWQVATIARVGGAATHVIPHGRIIALADGRLAATFYCSWGRGQPSRAWIAFSRDGGSTWAAARPIGGEDINEVVVLRGHKPDTLLAAARTHRDHHVRLHTSHDGGENWTDAGLLSLPMQHPADLTDLGEHGILLTYGIRNRGLMGIGVRLSRDDGGTWSAPAVLYQFGEATDCGYPSTVGLLADGGLLTAAYADHSPLHHGYHLLTVRWRLEEMFGARPSRALSDGEALPA